MIRVLADRVPGNDILADHAGFDTWDSAQRAKRVVDADGAVVVTGASPHLLGAEIPITGDGRESWGP